MSVCGIIAEYNPFHNGHAHHLAAAKKESGAQYVVVVMSGSFTQRGAPAILDKWTRAHMALIGGADVVLELPTVFALRAAQDFAFGGVALLHLLGIVTSMSFGSEVPLCDLMELEEFLRDEPPTFSKALSCALREGVSHPRARQAALEQILPQSKHHLLQAAKTPNATLGMSYLRALSQIGSHIRPIAIPREHGHHMATLAPVTSATAIRTVLAQGDVEPTRQSIPSEVFSLLQEDFLQGKQALQEPLDVLLLHALRSLCLDDLQALPDMGEGLEHRFHRAARQSGTQEELLRAVKCKRYPYARLMRIAAYALLNMKKSDLPAAPQYARVLGYRKESSCLLGDIARSGSLPVLVRARDLRNAPPSLALDIRATDTRALLCSSPHARHAQLDYFTPPVVI